MPAPEPSPAPRAPDAPLILCVDVDYRADHAMAAGVLIDTWTAAAPVERIVERVADVAPYVPGQFYKRELPCILRVVARVRAPLALVIVDGYVWLGAGHPGLGAHLHEALGGAVPVVGVAKTAFAGATTALPVLRGASAQPLYVTAAGLDPRDAAAHVRAMHGPHRVPTVLRAVDQLCRRA